MPLSESSCTFPHAVDPTWSHSMFSFLICVPFFSYSYDAQCIPRMSHLLFSHATPDVFSDCFISHDLQHEHVFPHMSRPDIFPHAYHTSFAFRRTLSPATRVRQNQAPSRLRRRHPHRSAASPSMRSPRGPFSRGEHSQGGAGDKRYDFSTPPATMR